MTSRPHEAPLEVSPKISLILGLKSTILDWHWHIMWHIYHFFLPLVHPVLWWILSSNNIEYTYSVLFRSINTFLNPFLPGILSFLQAAGFVSSSHHFLASGRSSHCDCVDSAKVVHPKWYIMWSARAWVCNLICEVQWWHENRGASVSAAMLMLLSPSPKISCNMCIRPRITYLMILL